MSSAKPGRSSWPSHDDHTLLSLVIILAGIAAFAWLLWGTHHAAISAAFVRVAHWHIQVLQHVSHEHDDLARRMLVADPARMTAAKLWEVAGAIGAIYRLPAAALLAGLGVLCFVRAAPARFTRKLDLDGLMREQARTFRTTAAFVQRRLGLVAPRAGEPRPADPALHAGEWIERYATAADGSYDEAAARTELARQLGPLWRGVSQAAPHVRVLYAAFALHLAQRLPDTLSLLGDMAEALATPEPGEGPGGPEQPLTLPASVVATADEILRDPAVAGPARVAAARHGTTTTALMGLLTEARRRGGVLQPALFNALRLVDRRLWYALHSLGVPAEGLGQHPHPNPRVEALGSRDHWAAECAAGVPLAVPAVERAVLAVRAAAGKAARVSQPQE